MLSKKNLITFLIVFMLYFLLDAPYLYLTSNLYSTIVKNISGKTLSNRYYSGAIVYIALALGLITLVIPNIRTTSLKNIIKDSIMYGGMFGFAVYATFDFTNHFMFEGWPLSVSIMDTLWGTVLSTLVTIIYCYLAKRYF
jgi:uncharacterized membrane protein